MPAIVVDDRWYAGGYAGDRWYAGDRDSLRCWF